LFTAFLNYILNYIIVPPRQRHGIVGI